MINVLSLPSFSMNKNLLNINIAILYPFHFPDDSYFKDKSQATPPFSDIS